jgi:dynactin 1
MIKRLEDLAHDSAAVKPHVIPQMKALSNYIAELVNFGISVRSCSPASVAHPLF